MGSDEKYKTVWCVDSVAARANIDMSGANMAISAVLVEIDSITTIKPEQQCALEEFHGKLRCFCVSCKRLIYQLQELYLLFYKWWSSLHLINYGAVPD